MKFASDFRAQPTSASGSQGPCPSLRTSEPPGFSPQAPSLLREDFPVHPSIREGGQQGSGPEASVEGKGHPHSRWGACGDAPRPQRGTQAASRGAWRK